MDSPDSINERGLTAAQPRSPVAIDVPAGACDCLTHIFGDPVAFPMAPGRSYTPPPASLAEINALHRALRVDRVVIVQPTIYGVDNACTIDALERLGPRACGVAVIDAHISDAELDRFDRAGIRGVRINLETIGQTDPEVARRRFREAVGRVRDRSTWHIQIYTRPSIIEALYDQLISCPLPIAFDHFGGIKAAAGLEAPGVLRLCELLQSGKAYVKLSAPYLASKRGPDFLDVDAIAQTLVAANPRRVLWGTNWPHPDSGHGSGRSATDLAPLRQPDDAAILNQLARWVPDAAQRKAILVDNAARLYGFDAS